MLTGMHAVWGTKCRWTTRTSRTYSHLRKFKHGHWRELAWLNNYRVPCGKCGRNLLNGNEEGMVEGLEMACYSLDHLYERKAYGDLRYNSEGYPLHVVE